MEEHNFEQRCAITFCVKLGETGIETFNKLKQAYGERSLSRSQVFKCYKAFSEGRESIKDEPRSGRPSTPKTDNMCMYALYRNANLSIVSGYKYEEYNVSFLLNTGV